MGGISEADGTLDFLKSFKGTLIWQTAPRSASPDDRIWEDILRRKDLASRTIATVTNQDLNRTGANLGDNCSFETAAREFVRSFDKSPILQRLSQCGHLVVWSKEVAIHLQRNKRTFDIYWCPNAYSGDGLPEMGRMSLYNTLRTACIIKGVAIAELRGVSVDAGVALGLRLGTVLAARHFREGFGRARLGVEDFEEREPFKDLLQWCELDRNRTKPTGSDGTATNAIAYDDEKEKEFWVAEVKLPRDSVKMRSWTRIRHFYRTEKKRRVEEKKKWALDGKKGTAEPRKPTAEAIAIDVVREGLKVIGRLSSEDAISQDWAKQKLKLNQSAPWFPSARISCAWAAFGRLEAVYYREIDQFLSIYGLLQKYLLTKDWQRPLSIAVFGPPGSGKGFTIKEILREASGGIEPNPIEFNAAQFTSSRDLAYAFRQAQDRNLAGETPLVIFDEFDCNVGDAPVGWLKYFLMPMQDGKFQDDVSTYRIGRAILIFAGGTAHRFQEFAKKARTEDAFKAAKAPDFISRLRGHLDISGLDSSGTVTDELMFRRAVVLRSLLCLLPGTVIDKFTETAIIDDDVVRAFLKTTRFRHGVRSMEAILQMASIGGRPGIRRETIPSRDQLAMHVDADEFLGFVAGQR